jgi:hypothetical protein
MLISTWQNIFKTSTASRASLELILFSSSKVGRNASITNDTQRAAAD